MRYTAAMSKVNVITQPKEPKPPQLPESFRGLPRSTIKVLKSDMINPVKSVRSLREE